MQFITLVVLLSQLLLSTAEDESSTPQIVTISPIIAPPFTHGPFLPPTSLILEIPPVRTRIFTIVRPTRPWPTRPIITIIRPSLPPFTIKEPTEEASTPTPSKTRTYSDCGGFRPTHVACAEGYTCIDDPWRDGCGMACDGPGICVEKIYCNGFIGLQCPEGMWCMDDPRDSCNPKKGGADCIGICI
ncbi:proteinase inhibitor kazal [Colletotrichum truncatum]|uniref:Proteinase inhibitor kazal n=1 Tax=Colletotrichum truncatum TaxID=5467 RepID=A0ACC3YV72_COLTU|nr:proteinase inhibitor kazal [Colletotrichum truncatum]KAF6786468.1 proteinase inhibitor kazal [Colletotrichum truncatum]